MDGCWPTSLPRFSSWLAQVTAWAASSKPARASTPRGAKAARSVTSKAGTWTKICAEQGLGKALVQAAEEWARSQGLTEMASDTWLENDASIRAHLKMGYEEAERLVHFIKKL
jgi:L-amino acid N-acyltransferase YncA